MKKTRRIVFALLVIAVMLCLCREILFSGKRADSGHSTGGLFPAMTEIGAGEGSGTGGDGSAGANGGTVGSGSAGATGDTVGSGSAGATGGTVGSGSAGTTGGNGNNGNGGTPGNADYVSSIPDITPEKPQKRTHQEVLKKLEELGKNNPKIRQILADEFLYPQDLLAALANNPEMTDFAAGYTNHTGKKEVRLTQKELTEEHPLFLQWDPRWGYRAYGMKNNIGVAGCGPTCLSMALFSLLRDESLTPDNIASYSLQNGYYEEGIGTAWALMEDLPKRYGLSVSKPVKTESAIKAVIDRGGVIICAMGRGDFTCGGHFIVIYGYDADGFFVNDPNCVARSRKVWSYSEIEWQIKAIWGIEKKPTELQSLWVSLCFPENCISEEPN